MAKNNVFARLWRFIYPIAAPAKAHTEITIDGSRQIAVWSHKGVLCAEKELVSLACGDFTLRIEGDNLQLEAVSPTGTLITGRLQTISFT